MSLQDLTPQLRTRLSRMERAVGWFVFISTALLLFGFGYYIYHTAERKGWFKIKAPFFTYLHSSAGLKVGDPVYMMGFEVGEITSVSPRPPGDPHNVEVDFEIREPFFRYLWTGGSYLKVNAADFLGKRQLEVTRGTNGYEIVVTQPVFLKTVDELKELVAGARGEWQLSQDVFDTSSNVVFHAYDTLTASNLQAITALGVGSLYTYDNREKDKHRVVASWDGRIHHYKIFKPGDETAWLHAQETPPVSDQLQAMVVQLQQALPNVVALTNRIAAVLDNTANATSNLNAAIAGTQPLLTNFALLSGQLREPGGLGTWLMGASGPQQTVSVMAGVDTNLILLSATLDHLADITSNLNAQVQANTNLLGGIAQSVADTDSFIQGLKHHWLFRSAFKKEGTNATNAPSPDMTPPRRR